MGKNDKGLVAVGRIIGDKFSNARARIDPRLKPTEAQQLALFQNFLCNTEEERESLSNAIELWDSIPRYSISRDLQAKTRTADGRLDKQTISFQYKRTDWTCTISPARVTDLDGVERDYFPGMREEIIEDALRKLAIDEQAGFFDRSPFSSGVRFSGYALRQELARRGHTFSHQEMMLSLDILSGSIIDIKGEDMRGWEEFARSAYLPLVAAVSKNRLKNDPDAKWLVQFHPLVTCSIDQVTYRQFNYVLLMQHKGHLPRWLHRMFVLKFKGADILKPLEVHYSTVKRDSGLLDRFTRERDAIKEMAQALEELRKRDILYRIDREDIKGPRGKILDVIFRIWPSMEFVKEVKAANRRQADAKRVAGLEV